MDKRDLRVSPPGESQEVIYTPAEVDAILQDLIAKKPPAMHLLCMTITPEGAMSWVGPTSEPITMMGLIQMLRVQYELSTFGSPERKSVIQTAPAGLLGPKGTLRG